MLTLGIESSCDDLSIALVENGKVLANVTSSQTTEHLPYGGVVPEIASRAHLEKLESTLDLALEKGGVSLQQIHGIAATHAPGLVGSLLVGLNFAKALAYGLKIPFRGIHHIEGHLWSAYLEYEPIFPSLALIVSGGHTHLFRVDGLGKYRLLGHTVDDAAGEAFDKVAKVMGLGFPGGPLIEKLAREGNPQLYSFAIPQVKGLPLHTSFSGMKTAALEYFNSDPSRTADLAASFQRGVVHALSTMVSRALKTDHFQQLVVAGGVACNQPLRLAFQKISEEHKIPLTLPQPKYCTDNGAMIAFLGEKYLQQGMTSPLSLNAFARMELGA